MLNASKRSLRLWVTVLDRVQERLRSESQARRHFWPKVILSMASLNSHLDSEGSWNDYNSTRSPGAWKTDWVLRL